MLHVAFVCAVLWSLFGTFSEIV